MGLPERRALKSFQDSAYPELKKAIDTAAGFSINVEVRWDGLAKDSMSELYAEFFPKVYFSPIINALKEICADDMGKKALKGSLKKVVICNSANHSNPNDAVSFTGGTLQVDHDPCTNVDDIAARTKCIVSMLEKAL